MVDYSKLLSGIKKTNSVEAKPINSTVRTDSMNSLRNRLNKKEKISETETDTSLHSEPNLRGSQKQPVTTAGEFSPAPFSSQIDDVQGLVDLEGMEDVAAREFQYPGQPEKLEEDAVAELREAFAMLASHIEDGEIVGQAIRRIMGHMQKHDFLRDLIGPEDIGLMTRGVRKSAGVMIQKKGEGRKSEKKIRSELNLKEFEEELGDAFSF